MTLLTCYSTLFLLFFGVVVVVVEAEADEISVYLLALLLKVMWLVQSSIAAYTLFQVKDLLKSLNVEYGVLELDTLGNT